MVWSAMLLWGSKHGSICMGESTFQKLKSSAWTEIMELTSKLQDSIYLQPFCDGLVGIQPCDWHYDRNGLRMRLAFICRRIYVR